MRKKRKGLLIFFIVLFILVIISSLVYYFGFVKTEFGTQFLTQYAGSLPLCCGYTWLATHPYSVSQSMEAIIADYKIVTEKFDSGTITEFKGCKLNTCNGQFQRTDEYGCGVWKGVTGSLECGSDHAYQCSCNTEAEWQQCGDRQVECRRSPCGCPMIKQTFTCYGECGGANLNVIQSGQGCYSKHKVYYKENLIYETPLIYSVLHKDFREGVIVPDTSTSDLHIDFQKDALYFSSPYDWQGGHASKGCSAIINDYLYQFPNDALTFEVNIPARQVFKGQSIQATIKITNNWNEMEGRLDLLINIPYKVFGMQRETSDIFSQLVNLKKGENIFVYDLPTEQVTDKIFVTPTFYILMSGSNFKGVNYYCFEQGNTKERDISGCNYISFGTIQGSKFELQVNPSPLWVDLQTDGTCPIDYEKSYNGKYCIRTDIKSLTCMQIGCPVISGHDYSCTSAGICAEVIYIYKDCTTEGCPIYNGINGECLSNGVCKYVNETTKEVILEKKLTCVDNPSWCGTGFTCDKSTQVCMENHVYNEIGECKIASDCYVPCQGMSVTCKIPTFSFDTGYCSYSGECISRNIDCRDVGCTEGYECVTQSSGYYVCEKEIIVQKTCGELGCSKGFTCNIDTGNCELTEYIYKDCNTEGCDEGYTCNEKRGVCEKTTIISKIPPIVWIFGGILILSFSVILYFATRKKRKK